MHRLSRHAPTQKPEHTTRAAHAQARRSCLRIRRRARVSTCRHCMFHCQACRHMHNVVHKTNYATQRMRWRAALHVAKRSARMQARRSCSPKRARARRSRRSPSSWGLTQTCPSWRPLRRRAPPGAPTPVAQHVAFPHATSLRLLRLCVPSVRAAPTLIYAHLPVERSAAPVTITHCLSNRVVTDNLSPLSSTHKGMSRQVNHTARRGAGAAGLWRRVRGDGRQRAPHARALV
jgi:hypothetical protein